MKNQPLKFILALVVICILPACARHDHDHDNITTSQKIDTPAAAEKVASEALGSPVKDPAIPETAIEKLDEPSAPDVASNQPPVVKSVAPSDNGGTVWNQISNYNAENPSLPGAQETLPPEPLDPPRPVAVRYNRSVDVYPVDAYAGSYGAEVSSISGEMIQQVFFPYGSAGVGGIDRKNLRELAQSLARNGAPYKLDVVGHASKPVNNVRDPIQREMINFKMAQKRADAVTSVLVKAGATPQWVVSTSLGDKQPNPHRDGKSRDAADRRAEVYLNN